jgi:hypothetical protein
VFLLGVIPQCERAAGYDDPRELVQRDPIWDAGHYYFWITAMTLSETIIAIDAILFQAGAVQHTLALHLRECKNAGHHAALSRIRQCLLDVATAGSIARRQFDAALKAGAIINLDDVAAQLRTALSSVPHGDPTAATLNEAIGTVSKSRAEVARMK